MSVSELTDPSVSIAVFDNPIIIQHITKEEVAKNCDWYY